MKNLLSLLELLCKDILEISERNLRGAFQKIKIVARGCVQNLLYQAFGDCNSL